MGAVAHNLGVVREVVGPGVEVALVCKADAYGHGLVPVGRWAAAHGADWLAVATVQEGVALREAGLGCRVMVMSPVLGVEAAQAVFYGLDCLFESVETGAAFASAGREQGRRARLHLKVDTGLHRFGCRPEEAEAVIRSVLDLGGVELAGVASHYVDSAKDFERTLEQGRVFGEVADRVSRYGAEGFRVHLSNSAGAALYPAGRHGLVRVGLAGYGVDLGGWYGGRLRAAMRWQARVTSLRRIPAGDTVSYSGTWRAERETVVGTLGVGYGDGFARSISNRGAVGWRGLRLPVVGLVCMDQTLVDATEAEGLEVGDEVELFGSDVLVREVAEAAGTNVHEVLTRVMTRVSRRYLRDGVDGSGFFGGRG